MASRVIEVESKREGARALAVVMGYMCIGLLVTAITCFGFSFWFADLYEAAKAAGPAAEAAMTYKLLFVMIGALIAMVIVNTIMSVSLLKAKKGAWIPYILYTALMGLMLAPLVMWIDFATIGTAFGITSAIFLILFLIGYFAKADLTPLALVGLGLLFSVIFVPLPFLILYIISPTIGAIWNLLAAIVCAVVIMLLVAVDANRMNREIQGGVFTSNAALYYAYTFYCDFIMIFLRVLIILASSKRK